MMIVHQFIYYFQSVVLVMFDVSDPGISVKHRPSQGTDCYLTEILFSGGRFLWGLLICGPALPT